MSVPINPLSAAVQVQQIGNRTKNQPLEFVCNGLSVSLLGVMLARELRDMLRDRDRDRDRRHGQGRGR